MEVTGESLPHLPGLAGIRPWLNTFIRIPDSIQFNVLASLLVLELEVVENRLVFAADANCSTDVMPSLGIDLFLEGITQMHGCYPTNGEPLQIFYEIGDGVELNIPQGNESFKAFGSRIWFENRGEAWSTPEVKRYWLI